VVETNCEAPEHLRISRDGKSPSGRWWRPRDGESLLGYWWSPNGRIHFKSLVESLWSVGKIIMTEMYSQSIGMILVTEIHSQNIGVYS
jgi:hypothetical protein